MASYSESSLSCVGASLLKIPVSTGDWAISPISGMPTPEYKCLTFQKEKVLKMIDGEPHYVYELISADIESKPVKAFHYDD